MDHRVETINTSEYSPQPPVGNIHRPVSRFLSDWKCWFISALSLLTLVLLFRPWLTASGPHGEVQADAFGRLEGSVPGLRNVGERPTEGIVAISGLGGGLAAAAAVITLAGALLYRLYGIGLPAVIGAGAANAVLVPATLLYLEGKAPELRETTEYHDELKSALGDFLGTFFGGGPEAGTDAAQQVATVALTNQALLCASAAVVTAALALSMYKSVRPRAGEPVVPAGVSDHDRADRPAADRPVEPETAVVPEYRFDMALPYEVQLLGAGLPRHDDDHETGEQRLLTRAEPLRRADNQFTAARRDRPTARRARPRPRPGGRASATPQSVSGSAASAKRAGGHCVSPRSGRSVISA